MDSQKIHAVTISRAAGWSAWHGAMLETAIGDDPLCNPHFYRGQFEAGAAWLYDVFEDGERVGCFLLTVETVDGKTEAVVMAAASRGRATAAQALQEILKLCERCDSVRIHTWRQGMIKLARAAGFRITETVLRFENGKP